MYKKSDRIGEINTNRVGTQMVIIDYNRKDNIIVEFQDDHKYQIKTTYQNFIKGCVNNPYDKLVYNIGYVGEGKYNRKYDSKIYNTWYSMISRCYDPYLLNVKNPTYRDCTVDEKFHCLQDFGKWYEINYYEIPNEIMCLDKDILIKNNKRYGPDTCIFVPQEINALIVKSYRKGNLPLGVCYHKKHDKYIATCSTFNDNKKKVITIGYYDNPINAFEAYKQFKENYIKIVADKYKDKIPEKLYVALYNYEIKIND